MADNSLKIKKSLSFTPQATPPANPQIGDMYLDSTQNKIVQYNGSTWTPTGNDLLDVLLQQNFNLASLTDFTQTGLELITNPTIQGSKSARLIHQAATTYSFQETKSVDRKYRGKSNTLSMTARSSASSANVTLEVTGTNGVVTTTLLSSTFTTGQITASVFNTTSGLPTVTVTNNAILNQIVAGATITGSGIPTGTTVLSVGSGSITLSANATATATGVGLKVSSLPKSQNFSFQIPADYNSITYKISALAEAGLPETYVDDIVIELTEMAMTSTSVTVPKNNNYSGVIQNGITIGATTTAPTKGTIATDRIVHSRVENRLIAEYQYQQSSGGSIGSGDYLFTLPFGLSFDSSIVGFYTGASPHSTDISKAVVGYALPSDGSTISITSVLVAYDATRFRLLAMWGGSNKAFVNHSYFNLGIAQGYSMRLDAPIANWKTNETETKTIPLSSSVIVTEPDSLFRGSVFIGAGSVGTGVARLTASNSTLTGDAIQYVSNSVNGDYWIIKKSGLVRLYASADMAGTTPSAFYFTKNATLLTPQTASAHAVGVVVSNVGYYNSSIDAVSLSGEVYCNENDVIRLQSSVAGVFTTVSNNYDYLTISYQGSTKILNPSSDQKVEIPTHELRFEGASARGSVATAIVKFDTLAKIKGDGFEVVNTAADGTVVTIKKAGRLIVGASINASVAAQGFYLTKNQVVLNSISLSNAEILNGNGGVGATGLPFTGSWSGDVEVGDKIRLASNANPTVTTTSSFNFSLQEQSVAVALQNVAPRWDDSDSAVRVRTGNGFGSTNTQVRRFSSVVDNLGTDIDFVDSATLGSYFLIKADGLYSISYTDEVNTATSIVISKGVSTATNGPNILAVQTMGASFQGCAAAEVKLLKGDIIYPVVGSPANVLSSAINATFMISKVGKTQGTVDVTPFVQIPQNDIQSSELIQTATFGLTTITGALTKNTNNGIYSYNPTTGVYTMLKDGTVALSFTGITTSAAAAPTVYRNGIGIAQELIIATAGATATVSVNLTLKTGETFDFRNDSSNTLSAQKIFVVATAISPSIVTPTNQVSSDTIPFVFKATAITDSDPVGTFNTYSKNVSTYKSSVLNTTAPTQSTSSMNINGVQVFAAPYNASTSAAQPSRFDIKIGKGLKGKEVYGYGGLNKTLSAFLDTTYNGGAAYFGVPVKYDEITGILSFDAGMNSNTVNTLRFFDTDGNYTNGYIVFNASKSPSLVSIPNLQPRVAYVDRVIASGTGGGTTTAGIWTTVPLTGVTDSSGLGISLASNTITIPAGTYKISAYQTLIGLDCNIRLRNTTTNTTAIVGSGAYANNTSPAAITPVSLEGEVSINSTQTFQLQYYVQASYATYGLGGSSTNMSENTKVANITITKIK